MAVTQSGAVRVNGSFVRVDPFVQVHSSLQVSSYLLKGITFHLSTFISWILLQSIHKFFFPAQDMFRILVVKLQLIQAPLFCLMVAMFARCCSLHSDAALCFHQIIRTS